MYLPLLKIRGKLHEFWLFIHLTHLYSSIFITGIHPHLLFIHFMHSTCQCTYLCRKSERNCTNSDFLFIFTHLIHHCFLFINAVIHQEYSWLLNITIYNRKILLLPQKPIQRYQNNENGHYSSFYSLFTYRNYSSRTK